MRVAVDMPEWLVELLDTEADRVGIARQALIKMVLVKYADEQKEKGK